MKVTRHSTGRDTSPNHDRPRKRNNHISIKTISKGSTISQCIGQVSRELLTTLFYQIRPIIQYSVVSYDAETSDISSSTRQKWELFLLLLIHTGLVRKNSTSNNGFDIHQPKWEEFALNFPGVTKLHFVNFRKNGKVQQFFVCLGKPIFSNYSKQEKAISNKKIVLEELGYMDTFDKELKK